MYTIRSTAMLGVVVVVMTSELCFFKRTTWHTVLHKAVGGWSWLLTLFQWKI